jgi:hypothetical protein
MNWMDALPEFIRGCKRVDVITINDEEARQLSENILLLAAAKIQKWVPSML